MDENGDMELDCKDLDTNLMEIDFTLRLICLKSLIAGILCEQHFKNNVEV